MLAWMGGKRSKLKHARKHHTSKPGHSRSSTREAGTKRAVASPINRTRTRPAKRAKEDLHKQGHKGKEILSTAERVQASVSGNSSDLEEVISSTSMMDEQEDNGDLEQLQGDANGSGSFGPEHIQEPHFCSSKALTQLEARQESKRIKTLKTERKAAVSLDLQAIQLSG